MYTCNTIVLLLGEMSIADPLELLAESRCDPTAAKLAVPYIPVVGLAFPAAYCLNVLVGKT